MRIITLAEAANYDLQEKIPAFRGKITKVFDRQAGTNDRGAWSFQSVVMSDLSDSRIMIRVKIWGREAVPRNWVGQTILVESAQGPKGIKGVTMTQDTYQWKEGQPIKKQIEIKCDDGCGFTIDQGQASDPAPQEPAPARHQPASAPTAPQGHQTPAPERQQPAPPPAREPAQPKTKEDEQRAAVRECIFFVARKVTAFRIILKGMDQLADERKALGKPLSVEQFQGMCTSIFIAGDRTFQWDKMPASAEALENVWPQPKQQSQPAD